MSDNNDFTHEFVVYNSDNNNGTQGTGKFLLYDDNINAIKLESIDNIKIGGGSNGRILATDGEGNLRWISAAAVSGGVSSYEDLTDLPNLSIYAQTADLATVATTGSYADLTNKPSLFSGSYTDLTNKPTLITSYNQLTDKPTIPTVPTDISAFTNDAGYLTSVTNITGNAATVSNGVYTNGSYANPAWITSLAYSKLTDAPDLATVATSGSYADLTNKPSLATVATTGSYSDLTNRPSIFSGSYTDLTNKPTLFDGAYLSLTGLPNLAAVATSGSYDDLSNKPSIPAAQVNADWNETISESPAFIFNKPSIPDLTGYATEAWVNDQGFGSGGAGVSSYNDLTDKPTIPSSLSDLGITAGMDGQVLTLNSSLVPVWATPSGGGQTFDQSLNTDDIVTFDLLTVTDSAGIKNFNGDRITNTYSDGTLYVSGSDTQTPVSILIGGAGPRNEWAFTPDGKLTLPEIGTGIGWTNTDTAPNPDTGFLYSSTISFDKTLGIVLTNNVAGTDITWVIGKDGKIKLPAGGDIVDSNGDSVLGGGASTGDITFDGVQIIGAETVRGGGSIELVPNNGTDYVTAGQYINIYPTNAQDAPHIHVDAGAGGDLILGNDNYNVDVNHNGDVRITAYDSADSTSYQWRFNNDGKLQLPTNGIIQQNGSYTRTTTPGINGATTNGVVWTSLYNDISSVKLTIQLETNEDGDTTGWHTQVSEAIIASRGAGTGGGGIGDPVMTVYGVTYTSTVPLATFTVQRNPTTQQIEVVATRTAATVEGISFRINSVEMKTRD